MGVKFYLLIDAQPKSHVNPTMWPYVDFHTFSAPIYQLLREGEADLIVEQLQAIGASSLTTKDYCSHTMYRTCMKWTTFRGCTLIDFAIWMCTGNWMGTLRYPTRTDKFGVLIDSHLSFRVLEIVHFLGFSR
ncbi:hypothetical protein OCU04_007933 [Sclerotinia nivalis]|uniref:Uncharacterized protein n=1 Tax=Sclerotinia nivalis TaxID=352851 RepID=A0A9X0DKH4_9HELO|nr:hypothetical protein OCU04_007933 [Sclerotinia nivalis]